MLTVFTRWEKFRSFNLQENTQDAPLKTDGSQGRYECGDSEIVPTPARNKTPAIQQSRIT